ncbi:hypothetical protein NEF87_004834 [Candidatus Lokiarchaeum ossiferum]|uniref:Uncharacterized protein n=1 Tax=Candidatus Lokiarchaeum ossiferum TaxID=2951803 RepID=A0ABY6HYE3_9ARCH|nr:hypothetical protein NEF87_004834 [Candidatus Lokiarchaeum sp. B-35]
MLPSILIFFVDKNEYIPKICQALALIFKRSYSRKD